jgi:transcription initiation factor IIE alpha subunit
VTYGTAVCHHGYKTALFTGNAVNSAINSNFKQVLKELQRPIEKALEDTLLEISNDCVRGFTYDQLCPLE